MAAFGVDRPIANGVIVAIEAETQLILGAAQLEGAAIHIEAYSPANFHVRQHSVFSNHSALSLFRLKHDRRSLRLL